MSEITIEIIVFFAIAVGGFAALMVFYILGPERHRILDPEEFLDSMPHLSGDYLGVIPEKMYYTRGRLLFRYKDKEIRGKWRKVYKITWGTLEVTGERVYVIETASGPVILFDFKGVDFLEYI